MKKLILVRHAKSSWSFDGLPDIDRPLNERGYHDAHLVGEQMRKLVTPLTVFLSSPAIRAMSTALIISRETNYPQGKIIICPEIYDAEISDYKILVESIDDKHDTALIFGHNPTISEFISHISGKEVGEVPTCAVFGLNFQVDSWRAISGSVGGIFFQLTPRTLSGESQ